MLDGIALTPLKLNKMLQLSYFHFGIGQLHSRLRVVVQGVRLAVVIPLAGVIKLFKDVLYKAMQLMHSHSAIVLPAPLVGHRVVGFLAGDPIVEATPVIAMQGVNEAAGWVRPRFSPLRTERIRAKPVIGQHLGIVVRIASHVLPLAIDEQLIELHIAWRVGLQNAVAIRFPVQLKRLASTENDLLRLVGRENHWCVRSARVLVRENKSVL